MTGWVVAQAAALGLVAELLSLFMFVVVVTRGVLDAVHRRRDVRTAQHGPAAVVHMVASCGCDGCQMAAQAYEIRALPEVSDR